ncbi:MAG: SDR family NAD(P)-dependent oxidoreductase [Candidatus Puniceispirillaceae bacterium]
MSKAHEFDQKVVLITGAAGGIGQALARAFAAKGAIIAASDKTEATLSDGHIFAGDLQDAAFASDLPQMVRDRLGRLDVVINNAGIISRGDVTQTDDEALRLSLAVNVEAPFRLCRSAIPLMAEQNGGAIINIASCWGRRPGPQHALYCMTKAALASLTECMGMDHAHQNIRVNGICPNEVNTPMLRSGFAVRGINPDTAIADLNKTVPLGRIAEPEDIADVALFLASDSARYICGELIEVNGAKAVS